MRVLFHLIKIASTIFNWKISNGTEDRVIKSYKCTVVVALKVYNFMFHMIGVYG